MLKFQVGQKFTSNAGNGLIAEVAQLRDEGREAWIEVRDAAGDLRDNSWVNYAQFFNAWTLVP